MYVHVYCEDCQLSTNGNNDMRPFEMVVNGSLFLNPETNSQAQGYECPCCGKEVTVVIFVGTADDGLR